MTSRCGAYTVAVNIICEGLLLLVLSRLRGHDEEVASSKKTNSRLECKNRYPIYYHNGGKMAIIDTLFMTKTAEKPYPLGPHIPI